MKYNSIDVKLIFNRLHMYKELIIEALEIYDFNSASEYEFKADAYIKGLKDGGFLNQNRYVQLLHIFNNISKSWTIDAK